MHPPFVKKWIVPLHERAVGRPTLSLLRRWTQTQHESRDQLLALQEASLRSLIQHATLHCPAHRDRLNAAGIDASRITLESLRTLPTLAKSDLRQDMFAFCDPSVPGGLHRYTTGGSSGDPLVFYVDRRRQAADQAARARSRSWFDIDLGQREFYLWGSPVERSRQDRVKSLRDRLINQRLVSAFHMTPERMDAYLLALERFDPVHVFGYPTSLARLARHGVRKHRVPKTPSLRMVFTSGEVLTPRDRADIAAFFCVPVADGYGSREAGFIAHECPAGRMHVSMESLIVELLDDAGRPVPPGATGEVTVTHLEAHGMPFIRYRTGDLARWDASACPCGRQLQTLAAIEGRRGDAIRTPDGGAAHALSAMYPLREDARVRRFQVTQQADMGLDVEVETADVFSDDDLAVLRDHVSRQFNHQLAVRIRRVDDIPTNAAGKHQPVKSLAQ